LRVVWFAGRKDILAEAVSCIVLVIVDGIIAVVLTTQLGFRFQSQLWLVRIAERTGNLPTLSNMSNRMERTPGSNARTPTYKLSFTIVAGQWIRGEKKMAEED
jgi:hypothetical protein